MDRVDARLASSASSVQTNVTRVSMGRTAHLIANAKMVRTVIRKTARVNAFLDLRELCVNPAANRDFSERTAHRNAIA